jgi:hypothetical protein
MTEQDKERLEVLRQERIARYEKMIAIYDDLLTYWSSPIRFIGSSTRLNQSAFFIKEQIENASINISHLTRMMRFQ